MPDKIAEILLKANAVMLRTKPPFKWASGILSPIYTDNRILMSYPREREIIVNSFIKLIKQNKIKFDGFAGTAISGIPWAAWLSQKLKKPMVYVRSEAKEHGKENLVEGKIEEGKTYIVVEDLISTGSSSLNTINAVRYKNGIVEYCIAIFTYELEKAQNNFQNVKLLTLTNFTSIVKIALKKKYISKEQLTNIMDWKKQTWRIIKSEAAKNNLKMGEFLNKMISEYKKKEKEEGNWNEILYGNRVLKDKDIEKIKEVMEDFRKEFEFR